MPEERTYTAGGAETTPLAEDRRAHKRFIEEVLVRYRDLEGVDPSQWGKSRDLSLGGLYMTTARPAVVGCHLAVEIHIPDETAPLLALGRVVRSTVDGEGTCGAGIQFLWISAEDRVNLRRLSEYFKTKYGETGES